MKPEEQKAIQDLARSMVEQAIRQGRQDKRGLTPEDYFFQMPDSRGLVGMYRLETRFLGARDSCVFEVFKVGNGYQACIDNHILPAFRGLKGEAKPKVPEAVDSLLCLLESKGAKITQLERYRG
jgi:hypothetical protein